jgi:para-aminobenzoate synthetase/4-amino-4-deoxychorismate lyase
MTTGKTGDWMQLKAWAEEAGTVFLDAGKTRSIRPWSGAYVSPRQTFVAWTQPEVRPVLEAIQQQADAGGELAGFIAYEAAGAFNLTTHKAPAGMPLVWFGLYGTPLRLNRDDWPVSQEKKVPSLTGDSFNFSEETYCAAVEAVRAWIADGDTYQVNLTGKRRFRLAEPPEGFSPFEFYCLLRALQPVPYGAYLNLGDRQILSCSPELFLHCDGQILTTRPMKGTRPRGLDCAEDARLRRALRADPKERAENVMIVDLMRNDLGRVCETGSIEVPRLFEVERYASVHQMTSTVTGRLRPDAGLVEILEATFPCGSITGAPKRRTLEIIRDLEPEPRGVYCGAIGRIGPGRRMTLSVAIRTLLHSGAGRYELGVGSGITWSSVARNEWRETQLKSHFVQLRPPAFSLIETLLCRPKGNTDADEPNRPDSDTFSQSNERKYLYYRDHLKRLTASARYWGFPFPRRRIETVLAEAADGEETEPFVVRLALDRLGAITVTSRALESVTGPVRVRISPHQTRSNDPFLCHKTDARTLYDTEFRAARQVGFFEALFLNEEGYLTEGAITNVFVCIEGRWHTPSLAHHDVLPGVWRRHFRVETGARESGLHLDDLVRAERVVIGNSVRGAIEVNEIVTGEGRILWKPPVSFIQSRIQNDPL